MDTGFFKWVWRFNALAIAVGLILVLALAAIGLSKELFRERRAPATVNVDPEDTSVEEELALSRVRLDRFTGLIHYDLVRKQTYVAGAFGSGPSKSTYNNVINQAFMDPINGETRWLLEDSNGLIVWQQRVFAKGNHTSARFEDGYDPETNGPPLAGFYRVVTADTSGDKRLSRSDSGTLFVSDIDGGNLKPLLDKVETIFEVFVLDQTTQILHLRHNGDEKLVHVSLENRKITRELPLASP